MDNVCIRCYVCRENVHTAWIAWSPTGRITCGKPGCARTAELDGLTVYSRGLIYSRPTGPRRLQGRPRCDYCGGERPPLRHCFRNDDGQVFCSLTCERRAARIGR